MFRPAGVSSDAKLLVAVWICGGGFSVGDASLFNATTLVSRAVQLGNLVIHVSFNYRVNGFGFLGSKEVKEAGIATLAFTIVSGQPWRKLSCLDLAFITARGTIGPGLGPGVY